MSQGQLPTVGVVNSRVALIALVVLASLALGRASSCEAVVVRAIPIASDGRHVEMTLNGNGSVAFIGTPVGETRGAWLDRGKGPELITSEIEALPDGSFHLRNLEGLSLGEGDQVAVSGVLRRFDRSPLEAAWHGQPGEVRVVAEEPVRRDGAPWVERLGPASAQGGGATYVPVAVARIDPVSGERTTEAAVYRFEGDAKSVLFRTGDTAPGSESATFTGLPDPRLFPTGVVGGRDRVVFAAGVQAFTGVWREGIAGLELVATRGRRNLNESLPTIFDNARLPRMSSSGAIAFLGRSGDARLSPVEYFSQELGANARSVAQVGSVAPGTSGARFQRGTATRPYSLPDVDAGGRIAFAADLLTADGARPIEEDWGVWRERTAGELELLIRRGDALPSDSSLDLDRLRSTVLLNDLGQIAFVAELWDNSGEFRSRAAALLMTDPHSGVLTAALQTGNLINLATDGAEPDWRRLSGIWAPGPALGVQSEFFNDRGEALVNASFTDGARALLVVRIPEPTAASLAALTLAAVSLRVSRHSER